MLCLQNAFTAARVFVLDGITGYQGLADHPKTNRRSECE